MNLNISTRASALAQDLHEIVVQVHLEAKAGDKVVWLLELQQAGAFVIKNLSATDLAQVLSIMAPNYLLSYARSTVSELVSKGGFPRVLPSRPPQRRPAARQRSTEPPAPWSQLQGPHQGDRRDGE